MSSILDALKKLEKETPSRNYPLARTTSSGRTYSTKLVVILVVVVCVCLGAAGISAYYWIRSSKAPESLIADATPAVPADTADAIDTVADSASPPPDVSADEKAPLRASTEKSSFPTKASSDSHRKEVIKKRPRTITFGGKEIKKQIAPESSLQTDEKRTDPSLMLKSKRASEEKSPDEMDSKEAETVSSTMDMLETDFSNMPPTEAGAQAERPLPLDRVESANITIQAISWGEAPEDRLVVINDQVLREGDRIENYQISRINPDDIVLSRGGKSWRLDF